MMNVLSLFDGMSCGQIALNRVGIKYDKYYASEIDPYAMKVTIVNYPDTIQLGSVTELKTENLEKIDMLIGGSPCQSFSFAGKRKGMSTKDEIEILTLEQYLELKESGFEFEGQSYLFWEYMRVLKEVKPRFFLLENVKMSKKWEKILSCAIGVEPILINSSLVSAQNRKRLYWTNIQGIEQPEDKGIVLRDILDDDFEKCGAIRGRYNEDGYISQKMELRKDEKTNCLTTVQKDNVLVQGTFTKNYFQYDLSGKGHKSQDQRAFYEDGKHGTLAAHGGGSKVKVLYDEGIVRKLTPIECERLQTVPDNYTNHVSNSQRYKMLGNGWTVDVICHIFKQINWDSK